MKVDTDKGWKWYGVLLLIVLLAFARGAYDLGGQSLWWDESLSLYRATHSVPFILSNQIILSDGFIEAPTIDNHPPLYFLLLHSAIGLFGQSEFALRLPSLIFGVLIVPLLFAVGRRLANRSVGMWAALLGAISSMYLWYIHEVRMYTMITFLGLLSVYALWAALFDPRIAARPVNRKTWLAVYVVCAGAMLATHYLSLVLLVGEGVFLLPFARRLPRRWLIACGLGLLLVSLPLLRYVSTSLPSGEVFGYGFVPLAGLLRDLLHSFSLGLSVSVERSLPVELVFLGLFVGGWLYLLLGAGRERRAKAWLLFTCLAVPVAAMYLASFLRPAYMSSRHLMIISPFFYLAVAVGLAALRRRWLPALVIAAAVVMGSAAWSSYNFLWSGDYVRGDHRAWGAYLQAHFQPGDVVILDPPQILELYRYYAGDDRPWVGLPRINAPAAETLRALETLRGDYQRLWLAYSSTPGWGHPDYLPDPEEWLLKNTFMIEDRGFRSYASGIRLRCFLPRSPMLDGLPAVQNAADVRFENGLRFWGYDLPAGPAIAGRYLRMKLYWQADQHLSDDYKFSLRLYDAAGHRWAQADRPPMNGYFPTSRWPTGRPFGDEYELFVAPGTPPGRYDLRLLVYSSTSGQVLAAATDAGLVPGQEVPIGTLDVGQPDSPPAVSSLPIEHRVNARFGDVRLVGYDLAGDTFQPGQTVGVSLYWQAVRKPEQDRRFVLRLADDGGRRWGEITIRPAGDGYPTPAWDAGEIVKGQHELRLPVDAPAGRYRVELAALGDGGRRGLIGWLRPGAVRLGTIRVAERPRTFEVPAIPYPLRADFGDQIRLLGYDLAENQARPGDTLHLTLYWQALRPAEASYTVFTHLLDAQERVWGQRDSIPKGGQYPTTLWAAGEVVDDRYEIAIDAEAPAGEYTLAVGLYDAATGQRLPAFDANGQRTPGDRVLLRAVSIEK